MKAKLGELFPQLANQAIEYQWSGRVANMLDGLRHFHNPEQGLWAAVGCNGRGGGYGTLAGELMSDLMMGSDPAQSPFPVSALKQVPFHCFHIASSCLAIYWKSWQDKNEQKSARD